MPWSLQQTHFSISIKVENGNKKIKTAKGLYELGRRNTSNEIKFKGSWKKRPKLLIGVIAQISTHDLIFVTSE